VPGVPMLFVGVAFGMGVERFKWLLVGLEADEEEEVEEKMEEKRDEVVSWKDFHLDKRRKRNMSCESMGSNNTNTELV